MGIRTVPARNFYECDRCGFESEDDMARGGYAKSRVEWAGRSYDGSTGGVTVSYYLCGLCANALRDFLNPDSQPL